ncbi:pimeloyl-ACP methyl ester esterase BioH [Aestuariibacter salexigens]|uniref:pimeloyl-ACP methyl ester esterase BioH n=1 Tax=Aestuariibacter salexigens TaxID=226010 RepID=UPI0003FFFFC4|nr:pimeloyl-ACP methyl ester esterase BioH [Aestuariibacter salexigens]
MTLRLFTETRGSGPDLVLLHGWGMNSGAWEKFAESLYGDFRLHFIDLPGFGRNADIMPCHYSLEAVSDLIAPHIPQGAMLMGWSLGGLIAQHIAIHRMANLSMMVMMTSTPQFVETNDWPGIKPSILQQFEQQLEHDFSKTLERFLAIQAMGSATARRDMKAISQAISQYPLPNVDALRKGLMLLSTVDHRKRLAEISVPSHWIFGRLDSLVPRTLHRRIEQLQPGAQSHLIEHASHAPFISHPQEIYRLLIHIGNGL